MSAFADVLEVVARRRAQPLAYRSLHVVYRNWWRWTKATPPHPLDDDLGGELVAASDPKAVREETTLCETWICPPSARCESRSRSDGGPWIDELVVWRDTSGDLVASGPPVQPPVHVLPAQRRLQPRPFPQPLQDASLVVLRLDVETTEEAIVAGRLGLRVAGRLRPALDLPPQPDVRTTSTGGGVDEAWDVVVDWERGILLKSAARTNGVESSRYEITSITFDGNLSPELFDIPAGSSTPTPEPPEDAQLLEAIPQTITATLHDPMPATLERMVELTPFPIFVPTRVPEDCSMHVSYQPRGQERAVASVLISYRFAYRTHHLELRQWPSPDLSPGNMEWRRLERDSTIFLVRGQMPRNGESGVGDDVAIRTRRRGTTVEVTCDLGLPSALEIAMSLREASRKAG